SLLSTPPSCAVLHKDYQSLLTLIYTSTTKITLVLRPTAPAPRAALGPIGDLGTAITSLATCATLFDLHGATLASYARHSARNICDAVTSLAVTLADSTGQEYLVRTGTVHDLVERARREVPTDNVTAVKQRWKADREMLEDSLGDINTMIEEAEQDEVGDVNDDEEDFGDEEWDEIGFGSTKKMSDVEIQRTKKVQPLVRFAILLHKRVVPDVLAQSRPTQEAASFNNALDALLPRSHAVVLAMEEVVAALYAPQRPAALASAVTAFKDAISELHRSLVSDTLLLPAPTETDLAKSIGAMNLGEGGEKKVKDTRKWFDQCLAQIHKSADAVNEALASDLDN
ncbi:hypothetical protein BD413DRAFT_436446, partial [Trametes elegans]